MALINAPIYNPHRPCRHRSRHLRNSGNLRSAASFRKDRIFVHARRRILSRVSRRNRAYPGRRCRQRAGGARYVAAHAKAAVRRAEQQDLARLKVATNGQRQGLRLSTVSYYAEKRTRTSTPLRALEPESSASANSAISAKDFKSMFFEK